MFELWSDEKFVLVQAHRWYPENAFYPDASNDHEEVANNQNENIELNWTLKSD